MFTRAKITCIYCKCGKQLSENELSWFELYEGLCEKCFESAMEAAYEGEK